jgi:tRNA threonylcarbamoyladenosine biosynthesis protein TsaB
MKLLAIDCSTEACSVALLEDQKPMVEQFELAARGHTRRLLPMVDSLLVNTGTSLSQLDAIAFACGPGSFTGLRICLGAVQGLAFGADLPVIPVSTLAALAQTCIGINTFDIQPNTRVLSLLDARMDEVYWALYRFEQGLVVCEEEEHLSVPEQVCLSERAPAYPLIAVGSGWNYADRLSVRGMICAADNTVLPRASAVALLAADEFRQGRLCQADKALPRYLREQVTWKKTSI